MQLRRVYEHIIFFFWEKLTWLVNMAEVMVHKTLLVDNKHQHHHQNKQIQVEWSVPNLWVGRWQYELPSSMRGPMVTHWKTATLRTLLKIRIALGVVQLTTLFHSLARPLATVIYLRWRRPCNFGDAVLVI